MKHNHPHDHTRYSLGQMSNHLRGWHSDETEEEFPAVNEAHEHYLNVKAAVNDAARIDVHPWALPLLKADTTTTVFAGMEGCIKADAMLSAILRDKLLASVYSFPSVTLGNCPELPRFAAEFLMDRTVVAVLDNDWADPSKEGAVENQGRIYQGKLLALGVPKVHLVAPPYTPGGKKLGVDDFLGAENGHLSELVCLDVEPPDFDAVRRWVTWNGDLQRNQSKAAHVLRSMAVFAGKSKALSVTLSCMANAMGVPVRTVTKHVERFQRWGAVEVDGILDTGPSWFGGYDWDTRPTIRLVPDVMHATVLPERTLLDVLGVPFFGCS